ncbi:MAG: winged helix-turn-helix transcriptional regulator [Candidatus Heimdallarchaeota archaeon]|nr:winged helix-turn-helix transcriptional regulator [Candidatus Heimdallarchaeota archaeon]
MDQENIFGILSNKVRRKILTEIYNRNSVSISFMQKEWGMSTGKIYHHLKSMENLISQNEQSEYILTEEGIDVCEWFLHFDGKPKVQKIDAISWSNAPLLEIINSNQKFVLLSGLLLVILGNIVAGMNGWITFGPFLMIVEFEVPILILTIIISNMILIWLLHTLAHLLGNISVSLKEILLNYVVSVSFINIVVVLLYLGGKIIDFTLSKPVYVSILLLSALFFMYSLSSQLSLKAIPVERSMLIALIIFSVTLFTSLILIL